MMGPRVLQLICMTSLGRIFSFSVQWVLPILILSQNNFLLVMLSLRKILPVKHEWTNKKLPIVVKLAYTEEPDWTINIFSIYYLPLL